MRYLSMTPQFCLDFYDRDVEARRVYQQDLQVLRPNVIIAPDATPFDVWLQDDMAREMISKALAADAVPIELLRVCVMFPPGSCHWSVRFRYLMMRTLRPQHGWRVFAGDHHATVAAIEAGLVFDPFVEALAFRDAAACLAWASPEHIATPYELYTPSAALHIASTINIAETVKRREAMKGGSG